MVNLLKIHLIKYPNMDIQDIVKLIYQNELGCEHLALDESLSLAMINNEYKSLKNSDLYPQNIIEDIGNNFCRVSLYPLHNEKARELLNSFFIQTAKERKGDLQKLRETLNYFGKLSMQGILPFDPVSVYEYLLKYIADATPSVHHSTIYKSSYHPAYRVIDAKHSYIFTLYEYIQELLSQKEKVIIAIDGDSASGKTSLSNLIASIFDCNVFHMDDYFLQPHQRSEKRLQEVGGNVDYERFAEEIAIPLSKGTDIIYHKYNCQEQNLGEALSVSAKPLTIIEGAYSMRPEFQEMYDFKIFLDIDKDIQMQRIIKRNGNQLANRFEKEWIPMEKSYIKMLKIKEECNIIYYIKRQ